MEQDTEMEVVRGTTKKKKTKVKFMYFNSTTKPSGWRLSDKLLLKHLHEEGFRLIDNEVVRVVNNIIYKQEKKDIFNFCLDNLEKKRKDTALYDAFAKQGDTAILRSNRTVFSLKKFKETILTADINTGYFAFLNTVVKITKSGLLLCKYKDLKGCVWEDDIIDHKWKENSKGKKSNYEDFVEKASGGKVVEFRAAIGYLLHNYKSDNESISIIFNDKAADGDNQNGRTGKGLTIKGLDKLVEIVIIDGKTARFTDNKHLWDRVTPDTRLIVIDDVKKDFKFELLNNVVSNHIIVDVKNIKPYSITAKDGPKIAITSNYFIGGAHSPSNYGRRKDFYFSDFFSNENTPKMVYNEVFFDDWNNNDWQSFYEYMFSNLQLYFNKGFKILTDKEQLKKVLIYEFGQPFWDIMESCYNDAKYLVLEIKKELLESKEFNYEVPLKNSRNLKSWIYKYAFYKGLKVEYSPSNRASFILKLNKNTPIK